MDDIEGTNCRYVVDIEGTNCRYVDDIEGTNSVNFKTHFYIDLLMTWTKRGCENT